jgi:acyl phosphate:glycerol-3-phosphate acyltransferase
MYFDILFIFGSYILGAVPHLVFLARLRRVRMQGDYHENLWNGGGKALGVIGVLGEFIKGVIPVLLGRWLGFGVLTVTLAGVAVVCGQMWPVFQKFNGEKGNSIGVAMAAVLAPVPALIAVIFPVISLVIRTVPRLKKKSGKGQRGIIGGSYSRSLPVGMLLFFLSLPVSSYYLNQPSEIIWGEAVLFVLIMVRRLTAGLQSDLKTNGNLKNIILKRLLYDRAAVPWQH